VYGLISSGTLASVKLPGTGGRFHRRVRPVDLEAFIEKHITGRND
jgi:hypothetical protein